MRRLWILSLVAAVFLAASCFLPAATDIDGVLAGDGGDVEANSAAADGASDAALGDAANRSDGDATDDAGTDGGPSAASDAGFDGPVTTAVCQQRALASCRSCCLYEITDAQAMLSDTDVSSCICGMPCMSPCADFCSTGDAGAGCLACMLPALFQGACVTISEFCGEGDSTCKAIYDCGSACK